MVHQGKEFGVDLHELEKVAKVDFPVVSTDYGEAIGHCDRVRTGIDQAVQRPDLFGGGPTGPVHQAYLDLHDAITGLLKETRTNLDDTGAAPDQAARHYADTDKAAKDELNRRAGNDPELNGKL